MNWPLDVFAERAAYAETRESIVLKLDEKRQWHAKVRRASIARADEQRLRRIGIPPLFAE